MIGLISGVFLSAATLAWQAEATPPETAASLPAAAPATTSAVPVTAQSQPSALENVSDFGSVDIEMAMVSDFSQLDLAELLDTKVETASRRSEPISKAPAIIEVLTRQQLYDLGARDLYTALTFLPGIELEESYLGYTVFTFRGQLQDQYNAKILLLINGHPSYEPVNSSSYLELIPLEAIKRIEVIRGPGSVLYGTNAFAGVINAITETQEEEGTTTDTRLLAGSFRTLGGGAGNRGRTGDLQWAVYAGGESTKGYPYHVRTSQNEDCALPPAEQPIPADCTPGRIFAFAYWNNYANGFADLQYKGFRLQGGAMRMDKQKYAVIPTPRFHGPNAFNHFWGDLSYAKAWEKVAISVRGGIDNSYRVWEMGRFPLPSFGKAYSENDFTLYRTEAIVTWYPVEALQIDQGVSYERSTGDYYDVRFEANDALHQFSPDLSGKTPTQQAAAYFAQVTWRLLDEVTLLAGNRTTWFQTDRLDVSLVRDVPRQTMVTEDPIINNSPRGGVVFAPWDELVFKALYGVAFRVPNHFETSAIVNQAIGTTENLKPETIRTAELGVDSRPLDRLSLRANGYYSLTDRLISRREPTTAEVPLFGAKASVFDNFPGERIVGGELSARAIFSESWTAFANGAYKFATNRETGDTVPFISRFSASGGLSYRPIEWLALKPNGQYFGSRGKAGAYWLLNAVADFRIRDNLVFSAIGNNLTDRDYLYAEHVRQIVDTLPGGPGRAFYGRITAQF